MVNPTYIYLAVLLLKGNHKHEVHFIFMSSSSWKASLVHSIFLGRPHHHIDLPQKLQLRMCMSHKDEVGFMFMYFCNSRSSFIHTVFLDCLLHHTGLLQPPHPH